VGTSTDLELEFEEDMIKGYKELNDQYGYAANRFRKMVSDYGGVLAAKKVLAGDGLPDVLISLWRLEALALGVEAYVLQDKYRELFTREERRKAKQRLYDLGYFNDEQP
jgi:hypothetical protein